VDSRRLGMLVLIALPALAIALVVRLTHHPRERDVPAPRGSAAPYLRALGEVCDRYTAQVATGKRGDVATLAARMRAVSPSLGYDKLHGRLLAVLGAAEKDPQNGELIAQFNQVVAEIGVADCVFSNRADPRLAYPAAPKRADRTLLSWDRFDAAIDGICADNSARTVEGVQRVRTSHGLNAGQRNFAILQLTESAHRRLLRLFSRLGQPPDDSRPYAAWIRAVSARSHVVAAQADAKDMAAVHELDDRLAQLNGEENWWGQKMGLKVCSANGPAFPPPQ
jgi:hypothetical protein